MRYFCATEQASTNAGSGASGRAKGWGHMQSNGPMGTTDAEFTSVFGLLIRRNLNATFDQSLNAQEQAKIAKHWQRYGKAGINAYSKH